MRTDSSAEHGLNSTSSEQIRESSPDTREYSRIAMTAGSSRSLLSWSWMREVPWRYGGFALSGFHRGKSSVRSVSVSGGTSSQRTASWGAGQQNNCALRWAAGAAPSRANRAALTRAGTSSPRSAPQQCGTRPARKHSGNVATSACPDCSLPTPARSTGLSRPAAPSTDHWSNRTRYGQPSGWPAPSVASREGATGRLLRLAHGVGGGRHPCRCHRAGLGPGRRRVCVSAMCASACSTTGRHRDVEAGGCRDGDPLNRGAR